MATVWVSLKNSLDCKSGDASDVHDPQTRKQYLTRILTGKDGRKSGRSSSGCSRSIANLRHAIRGVGSSNYKRGHFEEKEEEKKASACSPRSIGSNELLNPIRHEVILSNSTCELKITGFGGSLGGSGGGNDGGSTFVGTLRPGTPGPGGHPTMHYFNHFSSSYRTSSSTTNPRKFLGGGCGGGGSAKFGFGGSYGGGGADCGGYQFNCHKCGEQFNKWDAAESHHLSKHAVTELVEGDSSRMIVEIICQTSWLKSENHCGRIERILKIHNMQRTLVRFEEHREMVKSKASKLPKKHPRCLADGNELLRFYGTTLSCSLGLNGSSNLCISEKCRVCRIIQNGFASKTEMRQGIGVFTTSTSGRALNSIEMVEEEKGGERLFSRRKALVVCRVIAGRVHKPLENVKEMVSQSGFDSLAGKIGLHSNIEELYLLNPRALLPCFVVICKP